jgi:hypothetical protein
MNSDICLIDVFGRAKSLIAYSCYVLIIDLIVEHDFHAEPFSLIEINLIIPSNIQLFLPKVKPEMTECIV